MEDLCIKVKQPQGNGFVYMDIEDDNTLPLESLYAQFQGAIGLKFEFEESFHAIRVRNGALCAPRSGWEGKSYHVVFGEQGYPCVKKEFESGDATVMPPAKQLQPIDQTASGTII